MAELSPPVPIEKQHDCGAFDCGQEALNAYLRRYALQNHHSGAARTYVAANDKASAIHLARLQCLSAFQYRSSGLSCP